jgi:hypothetical protein
MNIIKPAWRRGLEFRAQNVEEHKTKCEVLQFEPLRVQQIREELRLLDAESVENMSRQLTLMSELRKLGYERD